MSKVYVQLRNLSFAFECDDAQRLRELIEKLEARLEKIRPAAEQPLLDSQLILLAAVTLLDELETTQEELSKYVELYDINTREYNEKIAKVMDEAAHIIESVISEEE